MVTGSIDLINKNRYKAGYIATLDITIIVVYFEFDSSYRKGVHMKIKYCLILLSLLLLFVVSCESNSNDNAPLLPPNGNVEDPSGGSLQTTEPDAGNSSQWGWDALITPGYAQPGASGGMNTRVEYPNEELVGGDMGVNRRFIYNGGELTANLLIHLSFSDHYDASEVGIAVLCDGIPVSFKLTGEDMEETLFQNFVLPTEEEKKMQLTFTPVFTESPGLIHIVVLRGIETFGFNPTGGGAHFFVENTEISSLPDVVLQVEAIPLHNLRDNDGLSYIYPDNADYRDASPAFVNPRIEMNGQTALLFETAPSAPGRYRTVFFFDDQMLVLTDGKLCIEWSQEEGTMLQYRIPLDGLLTPGIHRFFALTTRTDWITESDFLPIIENSGVFEIIP